MLDLKNDCCFFPEAVCTLGTRYEFLSESVQETDQKKHLSLRNIIDATPPVWIHLPSFHLGQGMVTNGEFRRFYEAVEEGGGRLYDNPELWKHVWQNMQLRLQEAQVPFEEAPGSISVFEEDYRDAETFLDAYLISLRSEIQRVLLRQEPDMGEKGGEDEGARAMSAPKDALLKRLFAAVQYFLRDSLGRSEANVLSDSERRLLKTYSKPTQLLIEIEQFLTALRNAYRNRIDKKYRNLLEYGHFVVEPLHFLERFGAAMKKRENFTDTIPLHEVLYPRYWTSPEPTQKKSSFGKREVAWEDQPVYGLTLYEAAAYTAWLSEETGQDVSLPNEAEFERASSWPVVPPAEENGAIVLDPTVKEVFPWQAHNDKDFHFYFGREGVDIKDNYLVDRKKYEKLLEETARKLPDQEALRMMEGFGWHWTRDRYSDDERMYQRFEQPAYPRFEGEKPYRVLHRGDTSPIPDVYDYQTNTNLRFTHFALKGSPGVIGGPGMTIRRYAAFPLRAYPNVGFRIRVEE